MSLSYRDFWPNAQHCDDCLVTEAETSSEAVFLAVHQPMRISRRRLIGQGGPESEEKKEADLLDALLTTNLPSGTLLLPIVGSTGVGKSHMVRWLDAHLRHRKDGVNRRIVRIPKSASLRRVLELILADLEGPEYVALRGELLAARMPPDLLQATHGLREKLLVALEQTFQEADAKRLNGTATPEDRERGAHANRQALQALLADPEIAPHFMEYQGANRGVLARIAERYMQGSDAVDGPVNQFTDEDLTFDSKLELAKLSAAARNYYVNIGRNDGKGRKTAVALLNQVVDRALSELLDFGGNSLTDLFVRMRAQLLKDGRELVLLVEDFAALAGIQGSLLDAIIREGRRTGEQELCVMRTALAVTEGYLANRQTVLSRAQYEWRIEDRPFVDKNDAIETFCNFVGGYLNAARWGKSRLEHEFRQRSPSEAELDKWLPNFFERRQDDLDAESKEIVEVFGFSKLGHHPLFPFNEAAIRQLANRHLLKGNSYIFNPRELLNLVLRETLLDGGPLFQANVFPPPTWQQFSRASLDFRVSGELNRRAPAEHADRLACLVFHWGDAPQSPGEAAALPEPIYRAFKLPTVKWSEAPVKFEREERGPVPVSRGATPEVVEPRRDPWAEKLQRWRGGVITQADANRIRQILREELEEWVDWEALLLKEMSLNHQLIALPNVSTGNPSVANTMVEALPGGELRDDVRGDQFLAGIAAMARFQENKRSWNYRGGENDSVAYANLIEPMVRTAEAWLLRQAHNLPRTAMGPLAQALLIGARLLDLPGATSNSDAALLAALFADAPTPGDNKSDLTDVWQRVRDGARSARTEMKDLLLRHVAARQGAGETVQAVDAATLLGAIKELRKTWTLPATVNLEDFKQYTGMREHLRQLQTQLAPAVQHRVEVLAKWRNQVIDWLGEEFEPREVIEAFRDTALQAYQTSLFRAGGVKYDRLRELINELQNCRIKETLDLVQRAIETTDFGIKLSAAAQVDVRSEDTAQRILSQYEQFLQMTTAETRERGENAPPTVEDEATRRATEVATLEKLWEEVETTQ